MAQIQVMSDLHLEIIKNIPHVQNMMKNDFRVTGRLLALCGDIGNPFSKQYKDFLIDVTSRFQDVVILCGNHEFYNNEINSTKDRVQRLADIGGNLHFLNKSSWVHKKSGIKFIGGTLWTNIPEDKKKIIMHTLNDYKNIKLDKKWNERSKDEKESLVKPDKKREWLKDIPTITADDIVELHKEEVEYIQKEVKKCEEKEETCVVMSHHAPLWKCLKNEEDYIGDGFANKLDDLVGSKAIQAWFYGHTHASKYFRHKDTVLYSNMHGYQYINPPQVTGFNLDKYVMLYSLKDKKKWKF